jgi:hypothetical protein
MLTCNISKIMHNVWLQHSGTTFQEWGSCSHAMIAEDYIQAFKHTTLYYLFKKGGPSSQGPNKSELLIRRKTTYIYIHNVLDYFFNYFLCLWVI